MNKQLIDRDNVLQGIEELKKTPFANQQDGERRHLVQETIDIVACLCVKNEPTVDAVEVIRCSKCKYFCSMKELDKDGNITMEYDNGACMREPSYFPSVVSDDYCSKAERREDDGNLY